MKRIQIITVVAVLLTALIFAYSQTPQSRNRTGQTESQAQKSEVVKAKKVLVNELPKAVEGIVLKDGVFRLSPGYKFVRKSSDSVAVALQAGGDISGSFNCYCTTDKGSCNLVISPTAIGCNKSKKDSCTGECQLNTTIDGNKLALAIY